MPWVLFQVLVQEMLPMRGGPGGRCSPPSLPGFGQDNVPVLGQSTGSGTEQGTAPVPLRRWLELMGESGSSHCRECRCLVPPRSQTWWILVAPASPSSLGWTAASPHHEAGGRDISPLGCSVRHPWLLLPSLPCPRCRMLGCGQRSGWRDTRGHGKGGDGAERGAGAGTRHSSPELPAAGGQRGEARG